MISPSGISSDLKSSWMCRAMSARLFFFSTLLFRTWVWTLLHANHVLYLEKICTKAHVKQSSPCLVGVHWNKASGVSYCWTTTLLMPEHILYIVCIGVINSRLIFLKQKLLKWGIRLLFKDTLQCKNWWPASYDKKCELFSIPWTNVARS